MITLVIGGVRSGKSEVAERLAGDGPVTYLATGIVRDDDFADRVAKHRARRPANWSTVEEGRAVPGLLSRLHGLVLVDALGTWVANDLRLDMAFEGSTSDIDALIEALQTRDGDTILVSEEVGLGVHPATELGRRFADVLGEVNRRVAEVADRVLLVMAGRVVELPSGAVAPPVTAAGPIALPQPPPPTDPAARRQGGPAPPTDPVAGRSGAGREGREASPSRGAARPAPERQGFWAALAFLTPFGGAAAPTPAALPWFPVVGAILGLILGGLWTLIDGRLGALAAAVVVVTLDLILTGALHFDGLVDSADGLLPHLERPHRLRVMAEPGVGAFGLATGAVTLIARTAALASLAPARPLLIAALWVAARTSMAAVAQLGPYARPSGLATAFLPPATGQAGPTSRWPGTPALATLAVGTTAALALAAADDPLTPIALVAGSAAGVLLDQLARHRLGGFTGDTLGATGLLTETVGLLVAVAALS